MRSRVKEKPACKNKQKPPAKRGSSRKPEKTAHKGFLDAKEESARKRTKVAHKERESARKPEESGHKDRFLARKREIRA